MPTSATHITVAERVAASNSTMKNLLGDPFADPDSIEGIKMRYAKLGSVGPDIFYAMADYGGDLQDLENFLIKVAGSFQCIGELMGKVGRYIDGVESEITFGVTDSLHQTFNLIKACLNEGLLALIVGPAGVNFWPVFEAARQKDSAREKWYWADYLHYIKSGTFVHQLIDNARSTGNANMLSYAYGYLTHYVTDVVGHPYVNQVVQGPWRLYWQRHHLVENFMDAYVWDRWHKSNPPPSPPSMEEQPLDTLMAIPNTTGSGAPVTFARLNDHINVGSASLGDPVDGLVDAVCNKIDEGLFDIGVAEDINPAEPSEEDFETWCSLVSGTIKKVYDKNGTHRTPMNLAGNIVPGVPARNDGYPTADDVAGAYGVFRLVLRMGTEEKIAEPQPPDIFSDITAAVNKLLNDLQNNLNSFPPFPNINTGGGGGFSWDSLWNAIKKIAEWVGETMESIGKTVFDAIKDAINIDGTIVSDLIKYILYLLNKALFTVYNAFRDVLVYAGYAIPFTNNLSVDIGDGHSSETLWRSAGNMQNNYPVEEVAMERTMIFSDYAPIAPPSEQAASHSPSGSVFVEHPHLSVTAPYTPSGSALLTPDIFLDPKAGPDDMFLLSGLQSGDAGNADSPNSIKIEPRNFGGAVANSIRGITLAEAGFVAPHTLPDYNLDGDRSYAWPCWDIADMEPPPGSNPVIPGAVPPFTRTPLRPEATINDSTTTEALADVVIVHA